MSKLQSILDSLEFIQESSSERLTLIVIDTEKIVAFLPHPVLEGKIKIPIGAPIAVLGEDATVIKALRTGKQYQEEHGPEKYGIPFLGIATPIKEDGKVVGAINIIQYLDKLHTIRNSSAELASVIQEMTATTDEVATSSDNVSSKLKQLAEDATAMKSSITEINTVLSVVQEVASQSHMLGLNAAIEAARAGDHGRGFSVVANEIRKMAETSKNTVKQVQEQLTQINNEIENMNSQIETIASQANTHAVSMKELNSAFAHIAGVAGNLSSLVE